MDWTCANIWKVIFGLAVSLGGGHLAGKMFQFLFRKTTNEKTPSKNSTISGFWNHLRDWITTDDETEIYYGIEGWCVGIFERLLFTGLYVLMDPKNTGTLGTLAIAWLGLKMTTYWIPLITQRSGNSRIFKKPKKLSYAPFMATIISLLIALAGGIIIKDWAGFNIRER